MHYVSSVSANSISSHRMTMAFLEGFFCSSSITHCAMGTVHSSALPKPLKQPFLYSSSGIPSIAETDDIPSPEKARRIMGRAIRDGIFVVRSLNLLIKSSVVPERPLLLAMSKSAGRVLKPSNAWSTASFASSVDAGPALGRGSWSKRPQSTLQSATALAFVSLEVGGGEGVPRFFAVSKGELCGVNEGEIFTSIR